MPPLNHDHIAEIVGQRVTGVSSLHGGMIGQVYRLDLADGTSLVAKTSSTPTLKTEGMMLKYLAEKTSLPVPEVHYASPDLLLMSHLPGSSNITSESQIHAADLLAELHAVRADKFGFEQETLIAILPQPNPTTASWIEFFRDHRLLYMTQLCTEAGQMPAVTRQKIDRLAARLDEWLTEPEAPSLIHGDLWTTNILTDGRHITGIVDPAIYYAHREIELAYTTLFGTFGKPFFQRYAEHHPLDAAFFDVRRPIYNLYPLLVHVRLFGGGYLSSVEATLNQFVD